MHHTRSVLTSLSKVYVYIDYCLELTQNFDLVYKMESYLIDDHSVTYPIYYYIKQENIIVKSAPLEIIDNMSNNITLYDK